MIDTSELRALAADLTGAPQVLRGQVQPVVHRGANNVKRQLRDEMGRSRHFKTIVPTINYDLIGGDLFGSSVIGAEIGPEAEGAGRLENIAYFGTSRGGGTVPDPQGALDAETPEFSNQLANLLARVTGGR